MILELGESDLAKVLECKFQSGKGTIVNCGVEPAFRQFLWMQMLLSVQAIHVKGIFLNFQISTFYPT